MLCIERDKNSPGDQYRITAKEPGFGRGPSVGRATIQQTKLALDHYFAGPEHKHMAGGSVANCPFCLRGDQHGTCG